MMHLTFQDITYAEDLQADLALLNQLLSGQIPHYQMEKRYICKGNRIVWVNLTVSLVRDPGGKPLYLISVIEDISRRKEVEGSLRESNSRAEEALAALEATIESSPLGVALFDRNFCYLRVNRVLAKINARTPEQMVGKSIHEILPGALAKEVEERLKAVLSSRKAIQNVEVTREDPVDHTMRNFLATFFPIFREDKVVSIGVKTLEVTELKKASLELESSREHLRLALEAGRLGTWQVDLQSGQLQRSPECARILGFNPDVTHVDQSILKEVYPEDRERVRNAWKEAADTGQPFHLEYRILLPDGNVRWIEARGETKPDISGHPRYFMGVVSDVTTRKRAEEELKTASNRMMELQHITEAALSRKTTLENLLQMTIRYTVRALKGELAAILLITPDRDSLVVRASEGLEEDVREQVRIPVGKGVAGRIFSSEQPVSIPDLSQVEVISPSLRNRQVKCLIGAPLRTKGETIGVIHVSRMDGNFAEEDLQFLQVIADRVAAAIDNARLYDDLQNSVQDLHLERELREQFVNSLSHDLRNPLAAIRVSSQLIQRRPEEAARVASLAHRIQESSDRADQMIQDLLDSSRIRAGQNLTISPSECDLVGLALNVREELAIVHGNRIRVLSSAPSIHGKWDCQQIRRALENLVNNAIKYGDTRGRVTIQLSLTDKRQVELSVQNLGNPIPPDELNRLFDAFQRGERTRGVQGWGIGLTIVRGIAEAHGGWVKVESDAENGTTFTMVFPVG